MPPLKNILGDEYETIAQKLDISDAPPAGQLEVFTLLSENITSRILLEAVPKLDAQKRARLEEILEKESNTEVVRYMQENIPEFTSIVRSAAEAELQEILPTT